MFNTQMLFQRSVIIDTKHAGTLLQQHRGFTLISRNIGLMLMAPCKHYYAKTKQELLIKVLVRNLNKSINEFVTYKEKKCERIYFDFLYWLWSLILLLLSSIIEILNPIPFLSLHFFNPRHH